jgi:hypothetical protein
MQQQLNHHRVAQHFAAQREAANNAAGVLAAQLDEANEALAAAREDAAKTLRILEQGIATGKVDPSFADVIPGLKDVVQEAERLRAKPAVEGGQVEMVQTSPVGPGHYGGSA